MNLMLDEQLLQLGRIQLDEYLVGLDVGFSDLVALFDNLQYFHALVAADFAFEVLRFQRFGAAPFEDVDFQWPPANREHRGGARSWTAVEESPRDSREDHEQAELEPPGKFEHSF